MTFGFREGLSTLDIRQSTNEDLETVRREVYVRRPSSRTSTNSGEETTPPGNSQVSFLKEKTLFVQKNFCVCKSSDFQNLLPYKNLKEFRRGKNEAPKVFWT